MQRIVLYGLHFHVHRRVLEYPLWRAPRYGSPHHAPIQPFVSRNDVCGLQMVLPFDTKRCSGISPLVLRSFVRSAEKGTPKRSAGMVRTPVSSSPLDSASTLSALKYLRGVGLAA
jgi:hypothetical protein